LSTTPKSQTGAGGCRRRAALGLLALILLARPAAALEGDPEGAGDHPLIPRYEGSAIIGYDHRAFERFELPTGPQQRDPKGNVTLAESLAVEGRHTRIIYSAPAERSSLEVFQNYQAALAEAGFETLFACEGAGCGERALLATHILYAPDRRLRTLGPVTEFAFSFPVQPYYLSARLPREEGDIYLSLYVARENFDAFPETQNHALVLLDVIEPGTLEDRIATDGEEMATDEDNGNSEILTATDAAALVPADQPAAATDSAGIEQALREQGRVAVYAIEFGSGSADLTEESFGAIAAIAAVLARNPDLTLFVVGHSDNQGSFQSNLTLSQRRAEAVVRALVEREQIEPARLKAEGVGMLAPVASNETAEGRALNRRVELVVR
jgi:outer membrane protein OmpA-like peptidoglycan-associated protein